MQRYHKEMRDKKRILYEEIYYSEMHNKTASENYKNYGIILTKMILYKLD